MALKERQCIFSLGVGTDALTSQTSLASRMASSWMLRRVDLVRSKDSEERIASIIRVTSIGEI
jgi:hypothetical protein